MRLKPWKTCSLNLKPSNQPRKTLPQRKRLDRVDLVLFTWYDQIQYIILQKLKIKFWLKRNELMFKNDGFREHLQMGKQWLLRGSQIPQDKESKSSRLRHV